MISTAATPPVAVDLDGIDRVVVVAPHPDDESLACGILLATAAEAAIEVCVVAVTDGEAAYADVRPAVLAEIRRHEQATALETLGVPAGALERLALPDGAVADHVHTVADAIRRHLGRRTLLVAPSIHDWHPDHEACGAAARLAANDRRPTHWSSLFWAHQHPEALLASNPTLVHLAATPRSVVARRNAIRCHRSQFTRSAGAPILTVDDLSHLDDARELYVREAP